jgi:hypothetical protein
MGYGVIDRNDKVKVCHDGRCVDKRVRARIEVWPKFFDQGELAQEGQLIFPRVLLKADEADICRFGQFD